jgi:hypothetical protein
MLELNPGVPVVQVLHIDYDPDGTTLQAADDLYASTATNSHSGGPSRARPHE